MRYSLIADDHELIRHGLRDLLEDAFQGVLVFEASDAASVTEQLGAHPWDLLVLDLMMPGGNTLELIQKIRTTNATVPILILTAATELSYVSGVMQAGANGFIHKSRASNELVTAVKAVLGGASYLHPETAAAVASSSRVSEGKLAHDRLSARELEIFKAIARGKSIKTIAAELSLSDKTVATYLARIREKTGLESHVDIARYALRHGVVD